MKLIKVLLFLCFLDMMMRLFGTFMLYSGGLLAITIFVVFGVVAWKYLRKYINIISNWIFKEDLFDED